MGILRSLLTKYHQLIGRRNVKTIKRRQFNMMVDEGLADGVKLLAIVLELPRYFVVEHLLQVKIYSIAVMVEYLLLILIEMEILKL